MTVSFPVYVSFPLRTVVHQGVVAVVRSGSVVVVVVVTVVVDVEFVFAPKHDFFNLMVPRSQ